MKNAWLILGIELMMLVLVPWSIGPAHASFTIGTKVNITVTNNIWTWEMPWQQDIVISNNGVYWAFWRTHYQPNCTDTLTGANDQCLFGGFSTNQGGTFTAIPQSSPFNYVCGENGTVLNDNSAVTTNGTFIFLTCDAAGSSVSGMTGTGVLWFLEGKLNSDGTVTWQPRRQVVAGAGCAPGTGANCFASEVIRVSASGRIFIAYTLNNGTPQNLPYVTESTDHDGTSWDAPTQLSTTVGAVGNIGYGWNDALFTFADKKVNVLYYVFTGDITQKGGIAPRQRIYTEGSGWSAEQTTALNLIDGATFTDNSNDLGTLAWVSGPSPDVTSMNCSTGCTPLGTDWPTTCKFQGCVTESFTYVEASNTWTDKEYIDSAKVWDEHNQLVYDKMAQRLYWVAEDTLCSGGVNPGNFFIAQKSQPSSGTWGSRTLLFQALSVLGGSQGGGNTPGCSGGTSAGGPSSIMSQSFQTSSTTSTVGLLFLESDTTNCSGSSCNVQYNTITLTADPPSGGGGGGGGGAGGGITGSSSTPSSPVQSPLFTPILALSALTVFIVFIGLAARGKPKTRRMR